MTDAKRTLHSKILWEISRGIFVLLGIPLGGIAGFSVLNLLVVVLGGNDLGSGFTTLFGIFPAFFFGAVVGVFAALRAFRYLQCGSMGWRPIAKRVGILSAIAFSVPGIAWFSEYAFETSRTPPSDAEMLSSFNRNESTLDRMVEMAKEDSKLSRVDKDWTNPTDPGSISVPSSRIQSYRQLCSEAAVPRGFESDFEHGKINFIYWCVGSAVTDDVTKGFAYLSKPPSETVAKLDGLESTTIERATFFRHIRGNWYLYLELIPD